MSKNILPFDKKILSLQTIFRAEGLDLVKLLKFNKFITIKNNLIFYAKKRE